MNWRTIFSVLLLLCSMLFSGCVSSQTQSTTGYSDKALANRPIKSKKAAQQGAGFRALSELTDQFSHDLALQLTKRKIFLDRKNIRDVDTGDVAYFSRYLQNELESSLSENFDVQLMPDEADILLGVVFQHYNDDIRVFMKYHSADMSVNKSLDYTIAADRLPRKAFEERLESKAYQLAANIIDDDLPHKIYVKPIDNEACMCTSQFSRVMAKMVSGEIVRMHKQVQVLGKRPVALKLSDKRAVKQKAKEVKELATADAFMVDADSIVEGSYSVNGDEVLVALHLKDMNGVILNSATVGISRGLIKVPLEDKAAAKLADLVDKKTEGLEKHVKLSTSRSGDSPVYHNGEVLTLYAQVKEPLYLYMYTIDRNGEVSLLYPEDPSGPHLPTMPGGLVMIPAENDDYELVIEPPFGQDAVKVFASPVRIPAPVLTRTVATRSYVAGTRAVGKQRKKIQQHLARQKTINPNDLVDYYKGIAEHQGITVYEDSLMIQTRP